MENDLNQNTAASQVNNEFYKSRAMRRDDEEYREGICPYYVRDRGKGVIYCECAHFHFPDKLARREYVYKFCAHPSGFKLCPIKCAMDHFYERKYSMIENAAPDAAGKETP
ncbi:MAG: hypothetical protein MJ192_08630 [Clostridia bacterium]|nr:hypothetical protein [Clostridia bacterium]